MTVSVPSGSGGEGQCNRLPSAILNIDAGSGQFIVVRGKRTRFWWSDRWGPSVANRDGDPADPQPHHTHPFWRAATLWFRQGKRMEGDTAVWHEPAPEVWRKVGREIVAVQEGEDPDMSKAIILGPHDPWPPISQPEGGER